MASPEVNFTNWFIDGIPSAWHAQRIETTTGRGVPDLHLCVGRGRECWIEFKAGGRIPGP